MYSCHWIAHLKNGQNSKIYVYFTMIKMLIKKGLVLLVIAINIHNVRLGEFSPTEAPQPTIKMGYSSARGPAPSGKAASEREREGGHSDTRPPRTRKALRSPVKQPSERRAVSQEPRQKPSQSGRGQEQKRTCCCVRGATASGAPTQ